jgi:hypothetical protein
LFPLASEGRKEDNCLPREILKKSFEVEKKITTNDPMAEFVVALITASRSNVSGNIKQHAGNKKGDQIVSHPIAIETLVCGARG